MADGRLSTSRYSRPHAISLFSLIHVTLDSAFLSIGHTSDSYWVRKRPDGQFHFSHRFFAHYLILVRPVDKLLPRVTGIFMPVKNTVNIIDQKKTRLKSVYYFIFVMVTCQFAEKKINVIFF